MAIGISRACDLFPILSCLFIYLFLKPCVLESSE